MLQHTFSAEGFEQTDKIQKYVSVKVRDLEKYIPRRARESAEVSVRIIKNTRSKAEMYECVVTLKLPEETLVAREKVEHSYAALDVTTAEIKRQISAYKGRHHKLPLRKRALHRLRGRTAVADQDDD